MSVPTETAIGAGLVAEQIRKAYPTRSGELVVLEGVDLACSPGEDLAIMGPSGAGKSTLLHVLGGVDPPSGGTVRIAGEDPYALRPAALARFRNRTVGFVFQDHHLLPQCTALENVLLPILATDRVDDVAHQRGRELLERVGLAERMHHRPAELSGGERQRASIARALVRDPKVLLCDEPTGALDAKTASVVADLLLELARQRETILIAVTHNADLAARFRRRTRIEAGRLAVEAGS